MLWLGLLGVSSLSLPLHAPTAAFFKGDLRQGLLSSRGSALVRVTGPQVASNFYRAEDAAAGAVGGAQPGAGAACADGAGHQQCS